MKTRDKTKKLTEYKGRWTDTAHETCPCARCWNPHDCGYSLSDGKWVIRMECATRFSNGCPENPEIIHLIKYVVPEKREGRKVICLRCGKRFMLGDIESWAMTK